MRETQLTNGSRRKLWTSRKEKLTFTIMDGEIDGMSGLI